MNLTLNYKIIGQQFVSYGTTLKLHYVTSSLKSLEGKRGFKFAYKFVEEDSQISSVLQLSTNQLGKLTNMNYPHECPIHNEIFLKASIGHQIELTLPRLTYMRINDGPNCQSASDHLIFNLIDPFGDISLTPPNPNIWSVCSESSEPFQTFSTLSSKSIKVIKSKFHVLHIKLYNNKRSSFMFYYKTRKGKSCFLTLFYTIQSHLLVYIVWFSIFFPKTTSNLSYSYLKLSLDLLIHSYAQNYCP